jgi:hypothetical protein
MNRMKVYDVPHKGLRNALSQLSLAAGNTDYTDLEAIEKLHSLGQLVFTFLNVHANDENSVTLDELEKRLPGASKHDMDDHEKLHVEQHVLEQLLEKIYADAKEGKNVMSDGAEFYLALSEYHSKYLAHTSEEERVTQPQLWEHFTDDELAGMRNKIIGKLPPGTLITMLRFIAPALNPQERIGLLKGFKMAAPPPFFAAVMEVVASVLPATDFEKLQAALA